MKIVILCVGKTDVPYLQTGIDLYMQRLQHYAQVSWEVVPEQKSWKKLTGPDRKKVEGEAILSKISAADRCILLDEKGATLSSENFAIQLEKFGVSGVKRVVYIIGGAYGFGAEVYAAVPEKLSLSKMTFSHQMVRLFLVEQLYRGFTILRNEPYHNP